jgi:hypothetical protein
VASSERSDEVLSPELALVDPDLARRARLLFEDHGCVAAMATRRETAPLALSISSRRPVRRRIFAVAGACGAFLLLTLVAWHGLAPSGELTAGLVRSKPQRDSADLQLEGSRRKAEQSRPQVNGANSAAPLTRRFVWRGEDGASAYHIEFFRGAKLVFRGRTSKPELTVPPTWKLGGRRQRFSRGTYQWYVWPIVDGQRGSRAIVRSSLVLDAAV